MKQEYWIAIAVGALLFGLMIGYGIWGSSAARVPALERELATTQTQVSEAGQKSAQLEANLGKVTNEKLNLEKENSELRDTLAKATKARR